MTALRNVWEEHGEGTEHDQHGSTFLELLRRLDGLTEDDIDHRPLWPEVRMFNTTLTGACVMDEYLVGVGVMGMIERMFADISASIGAAIIEHGWLARDRMIHYSLHQELDVRHAADFFNVLRPAWEEGEESRYYIEQGMRLGAHAFYTLYEGLYRARQRRWTRELVLPHVLLRPNADPSMAGGAWPWPVSPTTQRATSRSPIRRTRGRSSRWMRPSDANGVTSRSFSPAISGSGIES